MKWEELYKKYKNRKYQEIEEITDDFVIKANISNIPKVYKNIIIILAIILIIIVLIIFHESINAMVATFSLIIILAFLGIFFNSFTIKYKNKKIIINNNAQRINLLYESIKNIYIDERKERIFFKKRNVYSLIILYETPKHEFNDIAFPTILLSPDKIKKVFDKIILKPAKLNYIEKSNIHKAKRYLIKIGLFLIFLILIILVCLYY